MKAHTKIYFNYFGIQYNESGWHDFIPCECCQSESHDIHHIVCRGMGGSKLKDNINNLMALCRKCHEEKGDKRGYMDELIFIHQQKLNRIKLD